MRKKRLFTVAEVCTKMCSRYLLIPLLLAFMLLCSTRSMAKSFTNKEIGAAFKQQFQSQASKAQINGKVSNEDGQPLMGVSVTVTGRTGGTSTDAKGSFTIAADKGDVMVFSMVGYKEQILVVTVETNLSITLQKNPNEMNEVVVVEYGTQKKSNLTGAVSTIDAKMLESRPVQNVGQALQGLLPGLNFQTAGLGGELNQNLSFNIRGGGTIGAGSNSAPLVLVDGMEGNLNAINPQDIESITVLKDAASSAIYGSRAPIGVVLITTKKGKAGKVAVNYNNNLRETSPLGLPHMMDSRTFAMYFNEAAANDGEAAKFPQDVLDKMFGAPCRNGIKKPMEPLH